MDEKELSVHFWGARGGIPVSGPEYARYGGNTICIEMRCGDQSLIFDAGSGLAPAGKAFKKEGRRLAKLFLTHSHYDHMMGLPYFAPLHTRDSQVEIWSGHLAGTMTTRELLNDFMRPPWFPVPPDMCLGCIICHDFVAGDVLEPYPGVTLRTAKLTHPGDVIGYRLDWNGKSVALVTDSEHEPGSLDPAVLALIDQVDLLIYDGSYTDEEMVQFKGYGHSSWQQAIRLAQAAGVGKMALIHHMAWRTDDLIDAIEAQVRAQFSTAFAARDRQTVIV